MHLVVLYYFARNLYHRLLTSLQASVRAVVMLPPAPEARHGQTLTMPSFTSHGLRSIAS
jgi:hypothetical protein